MLEIPITNLPNQSFSIQLDNQFYDISIYLTNNVMSLDLIRANEIIVTGARMVAGTPLINYFYLENGNFVLLTANEEYPDYTQFGITQFLVFASEAELEAIRAKLN